MIEWILVLSFAMSAQAMTGGVAVTSFPLPGFGSAESCRVAGVQAIKDLTSVHKTTDGTVTVKFSCIKREGAK